MEKEKYIETVFWFWLGNCWFGEVGDHVNYMSLGASRADEVDEQTQLSWFNNQEWKKILNYEHTWLGVAFLRFLQEAPEDAVKYYLQYYTLRDREQLTLIMRDMHNNRHELTRGYFHIFSACHMAQKLLQSYDQELWPDVVMRNYGWDYKYEQKFGCLANWQKVLKAHMSELMHCPVEQIPKLLDTFE